MDIGYSIPSGWSGQSSSAPSSLANIPRLDIPSSPSTSNNTPRTPTSASASPRNIISSVASQLRELQRDFQLDDQRDSPSNQRVVEADKKGKAPALSKGNEKKDRPIVPETASVHGMKLDLEIERTRFTDHGEARVGVSFARPLGSQVAKRVLAEAEQSERALEQIFGELLTQMNIKDDMKAQMRAWDEGKKMTLLRQQRNSVANFKRDTNKASFQKYFDSCPLKVSIVAARGIPNVDFLDIYAIVHAKEEIHRTTTPWKLPFSCELICRDLMSVLKVQVFRKSDSEYTDLFMGEITLIMDALADDTVHVRWFDLKPMQGKKDAVVTGKLQLSLHLMVDKAKLLGSNPDRTPHIDIGTPPDVVAMKPKGVLNMSPLSEEWVLLQNIIANSEVENTIKESVNILYDNIELEEDQLSKFEIEVTESDAVWMDKIVTLGGLTWMLDHIGYLCYKLRSKRAQEKDKVKVQKLVGIVRKMLVSKTIINRLTNLPMALSVLLESLDHLEPVQQTEVFQMLIACQECKPYSGDLGDALEGLLNSNKRLFSLLLHELEKGRDLKFKEVFLTFINIALGHMRQLGKRIFVRAMCITLGMTDQFLMGVAGSFMVPEIGCQVEEFSTTFAKDRKEVVVGQSVDEQDFSHKLLKNLRYAYNMK